MTHWALLGSLALVCALGGCGDQDTGGESPIEGSELTIKQPADGAWFDQGQEVEFVAQVRRADGSEASADGVLWSTEGWSAEGAVVRTSDLPPGILDITAATEVEGEHLSATVQISVYATGDPGR